VKTRERKKDRKATYNQNLQLEDKITERHQNTEQ